jgi:DNA repair exonuclease SbcCD ATPase subunit
MDYNNINVSMHAKNRYIERVKKTDEGTTLSMEHDEDYIERSIISLIEKGTELYCGPTDKNELAILIRSGSWLILLDSIKSKVVTLYFVDLGLGEEFNNTYLDQMQEKIKAAVKDGKEIHEMARNLNKLLEKEKELNTKKSSIESKIEHFKTQLEENEKELKTTITDLENSKNQIADIRNTMETVTNESRDIVNTLLQRQVF